MFCQWGCFIDFTQIALSLHNLILLCMPLFLFPCPGTDWPGVSVDFRPPCPVPGSPRSSRASLPKRVQPGPKLPSVERTWARAQPTSSVIHFSNHIANHTGGSVSLKCCRSAFVCIFNTTVTQYWYFYGEWHPYLTLPGFPWYSIYFFSLHT